MFTEPITPPTLSLSVLSLNARGLRDNIKRKALFLFAKQQKFDFYFFQESHTVVNDASFWKTQWGNDLWFSHGSERSAGVTILKNNFNGVVLHSESDPIGHYIILILSVDNNIILLANIYGYNSKLENDLLFDALESSFLHWFSKYPNALLFMGGDFNVALNGSLDRWPPNSNNSSASTLTTFMEKFNLVDIWRKKNPNSKFYTLNNRACTSMSRIDYWLVSDCLEENNITANIITTPLTDHRAVSLTVSFGLNTSY